MGVGSGFTVVGSQVHVGEVSPFILDKTRIEKFQK